MATCSGEAGALAYRDRASLGGAPLANRMTGRLRDQLPGPKPVRSLRNVQTPRPAVELRQVLPRRRFSDLKPVRRQCDGPSRNVGA